MALDKESESLLRMVVQAAKAEAELLYKDMEGDVKTADLHYLLHEKLEDALDRLGLEGEERRGIRRELGRPAHLLLERR